MTVITMTHNELVRLQVLISLASATIGGYTCLPCRRSATCFTHIGIFDATQASAGTAGAES